MREHLRRFLINNINGTYCRVQLIVIFLGADMEKNKFKRAWIWIWYNDITRIFVLLGLPVIPILIIVSTIFGDGEYLRVVAVVTYVVFFGWALIDNNYSNLRRIGMNEYRKKI